MKHASHRRRSVTARIPPILFTLGLVAVGACGQKAAPVAPPAAPMSLSFTRDAEGMRLQAVVPGGQIAAEARDRLREASGGGLVEIYVRDTGAAPDATSSAVVSALVEIAADLSEGRVTWADGKLTVTGRTFGEVAPIAERARTAGERAAATVAFDVEVDVDTPVPGTGWLRRSDGEPVGALALTSSGGEEVAVPTSGRLPVGFYTLGDGRLLAIADGRTTWYDAHATGAIRVAGHPVALDGAVVVGLDDPNALSFQDEAVIARVERALDRPIFVKRFLAHTPWTPPTPLAELPRWTQTVSAVVLHATATTSPKECFDTLTSRGLSTHFTIDVDGTVYQDLDPAYVAFHAGEVNSHTIGVDLVNPAINLVREPDAPPFSPDDPRAELLARHPRPKSKRMIINGGRVQSYGYTEAQYSALGSLLRALAVAFPKVGAGAVRGPDGKVPNDIIEDTGHVEGVVAHWLLSPDHWDPGPGMDWDRLDALLRGGPVAAPRE
ncbi:MAG: N-acetylmuramoyl-L-alanine amidase [Deltaproteobacteria bacterium]|nr:MAG: N-acetylmuramoyl-L-alanine amidase [Deltaproteobacteria bacterium]